MSPGGHVLSRHVLNIAYVFSLSCYGLNRYHDVVAVVRSSLLSCGMVVLVVVLLCWMIIAVTISLAFVFIEMLSMTMSRFDHGG